MTSKLASKRLESLILAAAFLHREFLGQRATERFIGEPANPKGTVSYVYDHGVIGAYGAPWEIDDALRNDGSGFSLGQLLPRRSNAMNSSLVRDLEASRWDEDVRAQNITRLLTEYCLKLGSKSEFVWQFEEHFGETERGLAKARAEAVRFGHTDPQREQDQQLRNAILILRARLRIQDSDYSSQAVARGIQTVAAIHMKRENQGPSLVLRRMERLDRFETTFSARRVLTHPRDFAKTIMLPPVPIEVEAEHERAFGLLYSFFQREIDLQRFGNTYASSERDAKSLASLAIINKRLLDASEKHRVIFVTTSRSLSKVLYSSDKKLQIFLRDRAFREINHGRSREDVNREYRSWQRYFGLPIQGETPALFSWFGRFSLHYVRHLWSFAKDALIESKDTGKLENLFHGLFALRSDKASISQSEVENLIARPWSLRLPLPKVDPDQLYCSALDEWDKLVQKTVEQHTEERLKLTQNAITTLHEIFPDQSGVDAADVAALIRELVDRQRDRSMLELSDMGAMSLMLEKEFAVRYPPDLFFQSLSHTNMIFRKLFENIYQNNSTEFTQDYLNIKSDCIPIEETESGDDRQLSYLKFLALGAVFASTEKWATALGHATRAINTVTRYAREPVAVKKVGDPTQESNMSGREAYYLAAFCARMVSSMGQKQHVMGSVSARDYLSKARMAYAKDVSVKASLPKYLNELRFDCEALAQELGDYYMERWQDSEAGAVENLRKYKMTSLYSAANDLLKGLHVSEDPKFPFGSATTFQTQISIATNLLQIATIKAFREEHGQSDDAIWLCMSDAILERCVLFLKTLQDRPQSVSTSLVRVYMNAGAVILKRPELTGLQTVNDVTRLFEGASPAQVLAYDSWRFTMLRRFLTKRVEALTALPPTLMN